jgi:hypothetical protein
MDGGEDSISIKSILFHAAPEQLIQPDASIAWLSSFSCSLTLNALCSARVNSGVRLLKS